MSVHGACMPRIAIRRERKLPVKGEVCVTVGQRVERDTVVARAEIQGAFQTVNAASALGVPPGRVAENLIVKPGEVIRKGQLLGETRALFGLIRGRVYAPTDGVVDEISAVTGQVVIAAPATVLTVPAYLSGEVVSVTPGASVEVASETALLQGIFGIGGETFGTLRCVARSEAASFQVSKRDAGSIVMTPGALSLKQLSALLKCGVNGVVAAAASGPELIRLVGRSLNPAATGSEKLGMTILLTEGFGRMEMADSRAELLYALDGEKVSLSGVTQVRAGVIRPELLGPPLWDSAPSDAPQGDSLSVGDRVRVVRGEAFGDIGTITEVPSALQPLPCGAMALAFRIRLHDDSEVTVPRANVEQL